jgi:hypothetical protein
MAGNSFLPVPEWSRNMAHLYASFDDAALAEKAAGALLDYGVRKEDLSVVANNAYGETRAVPGTAWSQLALAGDRMAGGMSSAVGAANAPVGYGAEDDAEHAAKTGISTTTPEDAGAGAVKGAEIGLGLGILAGVAALLVPGVGLVLGGGALASAIGAAALTAGAGAERYQGIVEQGGAVLNVNLPSGNVDQPTAEQVIAKYHATDVNSY